MKECGTVWLAGGHIVDVDRGTVLRDHNVRVEDGVIAEVGTAAPPRGARVIDVAGRHLLPGLISCHTHLSLVFPFADFDPAEPGVLTAFRAAQRAYEALRAGVTTVRCVHEQNRADLFLRQAMGRGWFRGPRVFAAGQAISTPGGHGSTIGSVLAGGGEEFHRAALAELAAGADHVKVFINGGIAAAGEDVTAPEMSDEEIAATVRAADEHGAYVVAHAGHSTAIRQALALGVRSFEHVYDLDEETAGLLAAAGAYVTPTLCVTRSEPWMRAHDFAEATIENARAQNEVHLRSVRNAIKAGVRLVNGTDIPPGDDVGGVPAVIHELELLHEAGLSRLDALRSVTTTAARLLRADTRIGRVACGFAADFVAVTGDPLADLAAMRDISLVVHAGVPIREDLR
ncbi:amidohydrolase family protein [Spongiactinospora sp. 9N601]|uniref:amidohydrolase family protein n=1 Tax=Spongiactinospora sp. 9N601 TaxID=3375149 RepID=UPI003787B279